MCVLHTDHAPVSDVAYPSEGGVTGPALLKHSQEADVHAGAYEHRQFKIQTDLIQLLLGSPADFRQCQLINTKQLDNMYC